MTGLVKYIPDRFSKYKIARNATIAKVILHLLGFIFIIVIISVFNWLTNEIHLKYSPVDSESTAQLMWQDYSDLVSLVYFLSAATALTYLINLILSILLFAISTYWKSEIKQNIKKHKNYEWFWFFNFYSLVFQIIAILWIFAFIADIVSLVKLHKFFKELDKQEMQQENYNSNLLVAS
ncbi:flagellar biosynthesis protein FlhB [Mycoplasmoides fastidiosum]|uniref:Flagellar biosynthesis protein FlhB n=1 Tax=Mycoplasmoides fastidiosum TaxID=92758 RepID=A0ABU0LYC7_9BACT|nr:hypothetical protein [Mycoplasmoides fastidiosum]MDQ0513716.1 flagellar biosynthesis protein FlhB [Mycoplasmoides fastidiosum]UUD37861.1 hypothetical protein NPA10_00490 [Mycoplasmoides fastidiosum]